MSSVVWVMVVVVCLCGRCWRKWWTDQEEEEARGKYTPTHTTPTRTPPSYLLLDHDGERVVRQLLPLVHLEHPLVDQGVQAAVEGLRVRQQLLHARDPRGDGDAQHDGLPDDVGPSGRQLAPHVCFLGGGGRGG